MTAKAFCLMTVGRCGSTALMHALQSFPDIATPGKNIGCVDNELLHPDHIARYARDYERLAGTTIRSPGQLMRAFYRYNAQSAYAGFKSMPNRHRHFRRFVRTPDLRFITLFRRDLASTVASFLVAMETGCWRRDGGRQCARWTFDPSRHGPIAAANLRYVLDSIALIRTIPGAIELHYEDLCGRDFRSPELEDFFGRPIRLGDPKPPIHARSYVANWPEFSAFLGELTDTALHGSDP